MWGDLHEQKEIIIKLPQTFEAGKGNRLLRELGATLHYDAYAFTAPASEAWQSDSILHLALFKNGKEVDTQENFEEIRVTFPLATRPSSDQAKALQLINEIATAFHGNATYQCEKFTIERVQADWDACNDYLLKEWGEEPGSESLRIMIEENYA